MHDDLPRLNVSPNAGKPAEIGARWCSRNQGAPQVSVNSGAVVLSLKRLGTFRLQSRCRL